MASSPAEISIPLSTVVQILSPLALAIIGGASWTIKRIVGKLEASTEGLEDGLEETKELCRNLVREVQKEKDVCYKDLVHKYEELRKDCQLCQRDRQREREDCVDTYGNFGSRVSRIEERLKIERENETRPPT